MNTTQIHYQAATQLHVTDYPMTRCAVQPDLAHRISQCGTTESQEAQRVALPSNQDSVSSIARAARKSAVPKPSENRR